MTVRPAEPGDVPAIARLERIALGADAWSPGLVADGVTGGLPTVRYLVAAPGSGEVVAYTAVSLTGEVAELQRIAVDPAHRRRGLATRLLAEAATVARADGADRLLLEVRVDNVDAQAFYRARGFAAIGRRTRYYRDGGDAVVMELRLGGAGRGTMTG